MRPLLLLCAFASVFVASFAAVAEDDTDDDDDLEPLSLVPVPLARPTPKTLAHEPRALAGRCTSAVPMLVDRLPFGPGEQLDFDLAVVGVRAGRAVLRVEDKSRVDGADVYPVVARVRTDEFLAAFGAIDASMVSFLEPKTMKPIRMANRAVTRELFDSSPSTTREDAVFGPATLAPSGPHGGKVTTKFDHFGHGKSIARKGGVTSAADVVDALSMVYWLRSRALAEGQHFCFEMFHRRRLWRLEVKIGGVQETASPFATRPARRMDLTLLVNRKGQEPRALTVWVSDDDDHLPLLVKAPDRLDIRLTHFKHGRTLVKPTLPAPTLEPAPPKSPTTP